MSTLDLPRDLPLSDGSPVTLRLLTAADFDKFLAFTGSLPDHDLLFLRTDITDPVVIAGWLENIELGRIVTVVAEGGGRIRGGWRGGLGRGRRASGQQQRQQHAQIKQCAKEFRQCSFH